MSHKVRVLSRIADMHGAECTGKRHIPSSKQPCSVAFFAASKWNSKFLVSHYPSTRSSYSSCSLWPKSDYHRNRCGVPMTELGVRHWTLQLSGTAGGLLWTFRRHPRHSARCSRLSASLYLGKHSRSSFSAWFQVQELLWQVAPRKLKPQFSQMLCSPSLKRNETAFDQCWIE